MRVTCVVDDAAYPGSRFRCEHGVAFLIETATKRLLFDTGQSGSVLLHNLALLDVRTDSIEAVAISHGHYDHTGGLEKLVEHLRPGTPLYANPDLFRERFREADGKLKSVGIALSRQALAASTPLRLHAEPKQIVAGMWTTGEITHRPDAEGRSDTHRMRQGDAVAVDHYRDDMALVLEADGRSMLLCGCCHAGLLNTLAHANRFLGRPIQVVAGGLHLLNASEEELSHVCAALKAEPSLQRVYPNHCTGKDAIVALTTALGPSVVDPFPAGAALEL